MNGEERPRPVPGRLRLSIVVVAWRSGDELVEAVKSLRISADLVERIGDSVELVIVDNASSAFPTASIEASWPSVHLHRNPDNLGFGAAANQGARIASGDWLLLLNPDVTALPDSLTELHAGIRAGTGSVAVAPRLLEAPGGTAELGFRTPQLRRLPTLADAARELLLVDAAFPRNRWARRRLYADLDPDEPTVVEQPAAAALAIRKTVFTHLGGFDPGYFPAWFEDVDLCRRLRPLGSVLYWPRARFVHAGGVAAGQLGFAAFLPTYHRNAIRYWRTGGGRPAATAYRCLLAAGMLLRLGVQCLAPRRFRPGSARAFLDTLRVALWRDGRRPSAPSAGPGA